MFDTTYVLKQQDLDDNGKGDGFIDNIATADSDQTVPLSDAESTALLRTVGLGLEKNVTGVLGGIGNLLADSPVTSFSTAFGFTTPVQSPSPA